MRFRLPWTIMVDHRLPEIRAVDLRHHNHGPHCWTNASS